VGSKRKANGKSSSKRKQKMSFWNDDPSEALTYNSYVKPGDIIILGTDGLFDNLFINDILNIVDDFMIELYTSTASYYYSPNIEK
jgi:serine/threonine protein phosphatase PrpC